MEVAAEFEPDDEDAPTREIDPAGARLFPPSSDVSVLAWEDLSQEPGLARCVQAPHGPYMCPILGDYPLLRRLGRGGMGTVYGGVHPRLGSVVAVKVLHQYLVGRSPNIRRRFEREARIAAELSGKSPHLVHVYDVDYDKVAGCHFLVMEYIEGVAADQWAHNVVEADSRTEELAVIDVCLAATQGLVAAHRQGVIHRDVKPANILIPLAEAGPSLREAKLADLGLARAEHIEEGLTAVGQTGPGTLGYASPEQLEQASAARKPADVFAMGATIYRLLTGVAPFAGPNKAVRLVATMEDRRQPLRELRADVSDAVDVLVDTCLRHDPEERFPDASALCEALRLCRHALVSGGARVSEVPSQVIDLVHSDEDGQSAHSALSSYASRVLASGSRVQLDGGAPGATVTLVSESDPNVSMEAVLDDEGSHELKGVPSGAYTLTASHDEYEALSTRLIVRSGRDLSYPLHMRERRAFLAIASEPAGARVRANGVSLGVTPLVKHALAAGEYELAVELDGHCTETQKVVVRGGRSADLGVVTLQRRATLDSSAQPADVVFALDGEPVANGAEIDPGVIRLIVTRPGYESMALTVRVEPGSVLEPSLPRWRLNARALLDAMELWSSAADSDRRRAARSLAVGRDDLEFLRIEEFFCGARSAFIALFRHVPTGMELSLIPGGSFEMGSPPSEEFRRGDERLHEVELSPFLISRAPVTAQIWRAAMDEAPPAGAQRRHPMAACSWARAAAFCETTGVLLPTEAQWEHACRAGSPDPFAWGDDRALAETYAQVDGGWGAAAVRVAERAPNAFGLYDVHGGVWEWCRDRYAEYPFETTTDPLGPDEGAYRVLRGGSRYDELAMARSARRCAAPADAGPEPAGFRVVLELSPEDATADAETSGVDMEGEDA